MSKKDEPKLSRVISGHKKAPARKVKCPKYSDDQGEQSTKKKYCNVLDTATPSRTYVLRFKEELEEQKVSAAKQNAYKNSFKTVGSVGLPILVHLGPIQLDQAQRVADSAIDVPLGLFDVVDAAVDVFLAHFSSFPDSAVSKSFVKVLETRTKARLDAAKRIEKDRQKNRDSHAKMREDKRNVRNAQ